jgi:dimethylargininase
MNFTHAITRLPGADFAQGLTTASLGTPDFDLMLRQHAAYVDALRALGLDVTVLDPVPGYPDAYFTEDVAVLLPEVSVITRPGAPTRQGEIDHIAAALPKDRPIARILPPGTLEGGDVLVAERQVFVGLSQRTNQAGIDQLAEILTHYGYTVTAVPVPSGLHLKSGANWVASGTLLVQPAFAACPEFENFNKLIVPPGEGYAANTLAINGTLLVPKGFRLMYRMLETLDVPLVLLEVSEVEKMDGGLSCLSLRF